MQKSKNNLALLGEKSSKTFYYKGIQLTPLRNLTAAERDGWVFVENFGTDKLLPNEFDYDEFYKTAPRKDIFYCAATGKCYIAIKSSNRKGQLLEYKTSINLGVI